MSACLSSDISLLDKKRPKWADLHGLVDVACTRLCKTRCESISLLGGGSYSYVYLIQFSDGSDTAAQVSNVLEEYYSPAAKLSEIATMRFVRESGLYPNIPVPKVHAWDFTFTNPVRTPYVLMDVVHGKALHKIPRADPGLDSFDYLDPKDQIVVTKALAGVQASLSKPVPFDRIGSIVLSDSGEFSIGPLTSFNKHRPIIGGPYNSISDLWHFCIEEDVLQAMGEWDRLEKDRILGTVEGTPHKYGEILQMLAALIPYFDPPPPYNTLVLHHPDLALRNVLFDPNDLSKVAGVIDWSGAQILPLMFTAHYPDDLLTNGWNPTRRPNFPDEFWNTVPYDWTCFGGSPDEWPAEYNERNEKADLASRGAAMIRRFYLRQFFGACFSKHMFEQHGDADLSRALVFADAPYYLKFHETLLGGYYAWFVHEKWIRETFVRMKAVAPQNGLLITGPNIYRSSAEPLARDLAILEEREIIREEDLLP